MNEKAAFAERLTAAMKRAGLEPRPSVLEKEFNTRYWGRAVTYQAVSRWLKGEAIPSQDKLEVLADGRSLAKTGFLRSTGKMRDFGQFLSSH
jgi:transcriptional regulator with XRE-family HTH domain